MSWVRNNLKIVLPGAVLVLAGVAYLAFGVFGIHTKFIDDKVSEDVPVFDSGTPAAEPAAVEPAAVEPDVAEPAAVEPVAEEPVATEPVEPVATEAPTPTVEAPVEEAPQIVTVVEGRFGARSHPGSGVAKVITDGSEQRFLRFEDFETDNGPDLFVYLTTAPADAPAGDFGADGEFVNLGRLKGNIGEQNYEIPPDVDLTRFGTVVVWCDRFSVAFTSADLA